MTVSIGFGRVGSKFFPLVVGWVGLGQSADGLGHKKWTHGQLWGKVPSGVASIL